MTKVNPVGISLPTEIISKIDSERGDIPRSRYILRVLQDSHSKRRKLKEEGRSSTAIKNNDNIKIRLIIELRPCNQANLGALSP
jgi:metal-responsive CopG/Arc/MetJ family transcriptional regulator